MGKVRVIVMISPEDLFELDKIAKNGIASGGHWQTFDYVLTKAIEEFIKKYKELDSDKIEFVNSKAVYLGDLYSKDDLVQMVVDFRHRKAQLELAQLLRMQEKLIKKILNDFDKFNYHESYFAYCISRPDFYKLREKYKKELEEIKKNKVVLRK